MKVLFTDFGITEYAHPFLEKVVSKGCEMVLLLPEKKDNNIGKGVKIINEHIPTAYKICYSRSKKMWYGKSALIDLKHYLIKEKPDILMIIWPYFLQLFFDRSLLKILKKENIKLVIREIPFQVPPFGDLHYYKKHPVYDENMRLLSHGISFKIRVLVTMYIRRFIYRRTNVGLCYASIAKEILPTYGLSPDAIFYGNTTDTDALLKSIQKIKESHVTQSVTPRILHIGRLVKWKRVDLLIEAFHIIQQTNPICELVIIGDGPEKAALQKMANNLNIADKVIFTGSIYDSQKKSEYMLDATVYVLAGMGGLSINDAMCFSLPIICSVCDGTERDLVIDGENGFFFKEGDAVNLAEKLNLILSNPNLSKKMGKKSLQIIQEKVNINTVSNTFIQAFNYAIHSKTSKQE